MKYVFSPVLNPNLSFDYFPISSPIHFYAESCGTFTEICIKMYIIYRRNLIFFDKKVSEYLNITIINIT